VGTEELLARLADDAPFASKVGLLECTAMEISKLLFESLTWLGTPFRVSMTR
jgi:hypothetical protein